MSLFSSGTKFNSKVSSVLSRDVKSYGKQFLFDGREDTCWNSDQGSPQWIFVEFETTVTITEIFVQFQGGFAATEIELQSRSQNSEFITHCKFYPKDSNEVQTFACDSSLESSNCRLLFPSSTDIYGRIIVYSLDLKGNQ